MGSQSTRKVDESNTSSPFPFNVLEAISNEGSLLEPLVYGIFGIAGLISLANALL